MKNKFKVLLIGVLVLLGLVGCSSETDSTVVNYNTLPVTNYSLYDGVDFRMQYPIGWEVTEGEEVFNKFRSTAKLVLVSDKKDAFFTPNIIVETVELSSEQMSKRLTDLYDELQRENNKNLLLSEEVSRVDFTTIANGNAANGLLVQFKGKRRLESDVLTYLVALLKNERTNELVFVTAAFDELDMKNQSEEIVDSLKTLAIK